MRCTRSFLIHQNSLNTLQYSTWCFDKGKGYLDMFDCDSIDWRAFDICIVSDGKWTSVNFLLRFYYFPVVIYFISCKSEFQYFIISTKCIAHQPLYSTNSSIFLYNNLTEATFDNLSICEPMLYSININAAKFKLTKLYCLDPCQKRKAPSLSQALTASSLLPGQTNRMFLEIQTQTKNRFLSRPVKQNQALSLWFRIPPINLNWSQEPFQSKPRGRNELSRSRPIDYEAAQ